MCGLFAYAGLLPADPATLMHCAELAATRGPHSHGWTFVNQHAQWESYRAPGPLTESLDVLRYTVETWPVRCIVGHSRLATTGTYAGGAPALDDTMPFLAGDVTIVHNGNVRDYLALANARGYVLDTGCDSEIIARMLGDSWRHGDSLAANLANVMSVIDDRRPFAVIAVSRNGQIAAMHRELPLYVANADEGMYFCSRRPVIDGATVAMAPSVWGWPNRS